MWSYVTEELPGVIAEHFPADMDRQSVMAIRWEDTAR